jgi:hypothetical protein
MSAPKKKKRAASRPKAARAKPLRKPVKRTGKQIEEKADEGPRGWFLPVMESAYARLAPPNASAPAAPSTKPAAGKAFKSSLQPGKGEVMLAQVPPTAWRDVLAEYKRRKAAVAPRPPRAAAGLPPAAAVPGAKNWLPLGPTVVLNGQTVGDQPIGGRISGLAIVPGGQVLHAASANGGVFRSDDGGTSWRSLMDGFDLDPTSFASTSLACGAIAIDPADPNRVYVGTGEGDTHLIFRFRIVNALPAYRGIGPIRTDDAGKTWVTEPSTPDLAGEAFFALAVDPRDRDNVVAVTSVGLYQRVPKPGGKFEWTRRRPGVHTSVVVASSGNKTRFFAAEFGQGVLQSADGQTWTAAGTDFPAAGVGRIALGVQPSNPDRAYALVADANGGLQGLYRLEGAGGSWTKLSNVPSKVLPGKQGDYDLTIAVDPVDADLIYLGGDRMDAPPFAGSVWRCTVKAVAGGFKVSGATPIGTHAHADVHVLAHTPGDPTELWCGCDGGVFLNRDPRGTGEFAGQNNGLACLNTNFIAQHPTDPNILFTGLQDNGTARTASGPIWTRVNSGDGGYCLVNWANPDLVLVYANGFVLRSKTGGTTEASFTDELDFRAGQMTQPIVGPPFNPDSPADADLVAVGAGSEVFVSDDFANSFRANMTVELPDGAGLVYALAFATTTRLFIGTTLGRVFRADRAGTAWTVARLDNVAAGPLGLTGLISDVAVDWADPTLAAVYVTFGGKGDRRRVWRFDRTKWEARSGPAGGKTLLDVEHNALVVDRAAPANLYAGADIGVWHSADHGQTWEPLQNGLPDAPVFDLQIHATQRLLRAATHGRGLYELPLD